MPIRETPLIRENAKPMPGGVEALLVLWVATLPTDRVDLLGGNSAFILTPFLALTPLALILLGFRGLAQRGGRVYPANTRPFALILVAFASVILLSALLALDPVMSLKRALHFLAVSGGAFLVALFLVDEEKAARVLARGAELGLVLMLVFTLLSVWALLSPDALLLRLGEGIISLEPTMYGGIIPRFTGSVADPNRTGIAVIFFLFLLARFGRPSRRLQFWMGAGVLMALLTLSRSTLGAGLVLLAVAWLLRRSSRISRGQLVAVSLAVAVGAGVLLTLPGVREAVGETLEPVGTRFSLQEGSTRVHLDLMARGVEEGTSSLKRAVIGIGYGNAHMVLQEFFSVNKYGNFHSAYVTLLAECGVFALLLFLLILAYPLARPGPFTPMVAALAAFNVFYQTVSGPILWLVFSLAWIAQDQFQEEVGHQRE